MEYTGRNHNQGRTSSEFGFYYTSCGREETAEVRHNLRLFASNLRALSEDMMLCDLEILLYSYQAARRSGLPLYAAAGRANRTLANSYGR